MAIKRKKKKVEGMLFSIYWLSTRAWLVSLIIIVFLPICVFSNEQLDSQATSRLLTQFDELERSFQHSEDPLIKFLRYVVRLMLGEGRCFFQYFSIV
jgi:hypothetical protein